MPKPPKMNETQLGAVKAYLMAKANEAVVREAIEPLQAEAVRVWKPQVSEKNMSRRDEPREITSWKMAWLTDGQTFADMCADVRRMTAERFPELLPENPEYCPLLMAEDMTRKAGRAVVLAFQDYGPMAGKGVTFDRLLCNGVEMLQKFIDLNVKLAVSLYPQTFKAEKLLAK